MANLRHVLKPRRWILDDRRWTMDDRRWTICPFLTDEGQICHTIFREFQGIFFFFGVSFLSRKVTWTQIIRDFNYYTTFKFVTQLRAKTNKRTSFICVPKDDGCQSSIRFLADEGHICHTILRDMISIFKNNRVSGLSRSVTWIIRDCTQSIVIWGVTR